MSKASLAERIFPFLGWLKGYKPAYLKSDLVAGSTVALVLIPQSMAYAQLAGLPAYYGLYAAALPPMVASLFGSSLQLATGPAAVISLMTAAVLEPLAGAGSQAFITYVLALTLLIGLFQIALGALRLGAVVNFLSHPVVNGFTNAAALIIASSQLAKFLGVSVEKAHLHVLTVMRVFQAAAHYTHWPSFFLGLLAFAIMIVLKKLSPRAPYVLVAVVVTTLISWLVGFEHKLEVPLDQVASPVLAKELARYNHLQAQLASLRRDRRRALQQAERARRQLGEENATTRKLEFQAAVIRLRIKEHQELAGLVRDRMRRMLLVRVQVSPGRWRFFPRGEQPAGGKSDGRIWRLEVGRGPLDPRRLVLSGGGEVVGRVPSGLPSFSLPLVSPARMMELFPYAVIIALLGFMEAISIAKAMASQTGQRIDPNQELIGQGLANLVGSFFQSYPVSGSFGRSAVNLQAGARTGLSGVFTGLVVMVVLLFLTPLLYHLPQSVLAAVIMMAVVGLINFSGLVHAWRAQWYDGAISLITFVSTLAFAPHLDRGILIGVVLSLGVYLYKSMHPLVVSLGVSEDGTFHDAEHFGLNRCRHIAMIRFDGPLFFANAGLLEEKVRQLRANMPELKHIHIVADAINEIDASGEEALSHLVDRMRKAGYGISFSGLHWNVMEVLKRTHLLAKIGEENIFSDAREALEVIYPATHPNPDDEKHCPLHEVCKLGMDADTKGGS